MFTNARMGKFIEIACVRIVLMGNVSTPVVQLGIFLELQTICQSCSNHRSLFKNCKNRMIAITKASIKMTMQICSSIVYFYLWVNSQQHNVLLTFAIDPLMIVGPFNPITHDSSTTTSIQCLEIHNHFPRWLPQNADGMDVCGLQWRQLYVMSDVNTQKRYQFQCN